MNAETRKPRLRIIFDISNEEIAEAARRNLRARHKEEERHPGSHRPLGVASHTARFPVVCEECEETFWAASPYALHRQCRPPRTQGRFGFP